MTTMRLQDFKAINDKMLWKGGALAQIERFEALARRLGIVVHAVSKHTSKSIDLPVVRGDTGTLVFMLRDNFYDINLYINSIEAVRLPLGEFFADIHGGLDWGWYLEQIDKARGYSWKQWTDEQMDDPEVLHVTSRSAKGDRIDWHKRREEKDRWVKRMSDPAWYSRDWSSCVLTWTGEFGPGATLYPQTHPFGQGVDEIISPAVSRIYKPGLFEFIISLPNIEAAETVIRRVSA